MMLSSKSGRKERDFLDSAFFLLYAHIEDVPENVLLICGAFSDAKKDRL